MQTVETISVAAGVCRKDCIICIISIASRIRAHLEAYVVSSTVLTGFNIRFSGQDVLPIWVGALGTAHLFANMMELDLVYMQLK